MTKQKILIFGGSGSLGNELTKYYIDNYDIVVASRDEAKLWSMRNKFRNQNLKTLICDVREEDRTYNILLNEQPDVVIIAHALKQIDICEQFPEESVKTNIIGVMNITNSIRKLLLSKLYAPKMTCFVSTDKSCNPISVYGCSKMISERVVNNLSLLFEGRAEKIITVRYGNVLSSRGSVIPLFIRQGTDSSCKEFTITNEQMSRFMMSLREAVDLIDIALTRGQNGQLWVPKLPSMRIYDLVKYFSQKYNKSIKNIGIRGIEKLHEVMLSREEAIKVDINGKYFVYHNDNKIQNNLTDEFSSANCLVSYEYLADFMDDFLPTIEQ